MKKCPVCLYESERTVVVSKQSFLDVDCPKCGKYIIENHMGGLLDQIENEEKQDKVLRTKISYWIRQNNKNQKVVLYDVEKFFSLNDIKKELPKPAEQAELFIKWLGDTLKSPEDNISLNFEEFSSIIGANGNDGVYYIADELNKNGLINVDFTFDETQNIGLTFKGWEEYEEIKRKGIHTKRAFMAMRYGNTEHDEKPEAGIMDNRLRVEIRNSRFLLADLTGNNNGVYWEAGYAEGMGKPVVYLCEKTSFDEKKPHFDTNHCTTIVWDKNNIEKSMQELIYTIRYTLPSESIME